MSRKRNIMGAIGSAIVIIAIASGLVIAAFYAFLMIGIASWGSSK